jgi:DNA-binding XRE family transcriptional regulator
MLKRRPSERQKGLARATKKLHKRPKRPGKEPHAAAHFRCMFGQNLVELRRGAGLSQVGLAERAGLARTEISLLEGGKRLPRLDTIVKLGGGLETEPCRLLIGMELQLDPPKEESK